MLFAKCQGCVIKAWSCLSPNNSGEQTEQQKEV